jgi:hypothetical protein
LNAKEFYLRLTAQLKEARQAAQSQESYQSMRTNWHEIEAGLARHRARKPRFDFIFEALIGEEPKFTKLCFNLLEWVLILGALRYLHDKTNSGSVSIVFWISLGLFALYVPFAVGRFFEFFRFPFIKSAALTILLHICVSVSAGLGTLYLLKSLVYEIAKHPG